MVLEWAPSRLGYVAVFGLAALVCFAAIAPARERVEDRDTRWGLTALLATNGLWAAMLAGRLIVPQTPLSIAFYIIGLVVGLATVGAWLYFCSAYANESYHREPQYRWLAVGVYASIVAVKLTNPLHGLYFSAAMTDTPFTHLEIQLGILHWIVTGLAYALSAVGFYILLDLFQDSNYATTRLGGIVGLAGLPVVFDVISYAAPDALPTLNYEPVGVALFALGVLYVADGSFLAVQRFGREQLLDELDEGIVIVDADGVIQDANDAARRLFPALAESPGEPISRVVPQLDPDVHDGTARVIALDDDDPQAYYLVSGTTLTVGQTTIGHALVFTDVTEVERQRREVARQREQFDDLAEAVTHELRNTVGIVRGHLQLVETRLDPESDPRMADHLATVAETTDRMLGIVEDLATLARFGRTAEETTRVEVTPVARQVWTAVAPDDRRLVIPNDGTVEAEPNRLERLFENLFRFSIKNGATELELACSETGIVMTDDGKPLAAGEADRAFEYGEAVPDAESGMTLPVVRTLAEAHGWTVTIDTAYQDGVRVRIDY